MENRYERWPQLRSAATEETSAPGQGVNDIGHEIMPNVKVRWASTSLAVEDILRSGRIVDGFRGRKIHRSIIHGMREGIRRLQKKVMSVAFRNGNLKGIIKGLRVRQLRYQRGLQVRIVAMAQRRLKGVFLGLTGEMIAARAKVSHADDHAPREFPFHVEVILQRIWEFRMVGCRERVEWLGDGRILGAQEPGKNELLQTEERRQKPVQGEQDSRELIAIDAESAPHHSLAVTEDIPCKACLR